MTTGWNNFFENTAKVGGILTIPCILLGAVIYIAKSETGNLRPDISSIQSDITTLKDEVRGLNGSLDKTNTKIDTLLNEALQRAFPAATVKPTKYQIQAAGKIIELAQLDKRKINDIVLRNVGETVAKATDIPSLGPSAWATLTTAVNYKSSLNRVQPELGHTNDSAAYNFSLSFTGMSAATGPAVQVRLSDRDAPDSEAARLESLSKPNLHSSGKQFIIVYGGAMAIGLDGAFMKNVIFRNVLITYDGGPVRLENVYFENCSFKLKNVSPVQKLGTEILRASAVNFESAVPTGD